MKSTEDQFLDITTQVCPMTFVRCKLTIERMAPGEILEIRLNAGEPLENVPRALAEAGHVVVALTPETPARPDGVYRLRILRN